MQFRYDAGDILALIIILIFAVLFLYHWTVASIKKWWKGD